MREVFAHANVAAGPLTAHARERGKKSRRALAARNAEVAGRTAPRKVALKDFGSDRDQ
jgi:hypothetical protein